VRPNMTIPGGKAVLIFDGVCNFCNRSVNFVMNRDRRGRFLFASSQSEAGSALLRRFGVDPDSVQSVYLVEGDRIWSRSDATVQIARRMPFPWNLGYAGVVLPKFLRDRLYDGIARNRYRWFGKSESCRLPTEAERAKFL
jgi:predicted DCC family thiol-disulfide oxidoreductase YuxK